MSSRDGTRKLRLVLLIIFAIGIILTGIGFGLLSQHSVSMGFIIIGLFLAIISGILVLIFSLLIFLDRVSAKDILDPVEEEQQIRNKIELVRKSYQDTVIVTKNFQYAFSPARTPELKESCMISKKELEETDEILQCIYCKNFYLENYLIPWVLEKGKCPVCKKNLISKNK